MKNKIALIAVLVSVVGLTAASVEFQRQDLASAIFPATSVGAVRVIGTAATGSQVDIANYGGAFALISVGHSVDTAAVRYAVLSDSSAGSAAALYDSVAVDSTDNAQYKIAYRGTKRWLRITIRGTGGTDTTFVAGTIIRGNARSRS